MEACYPRAVQVNLRLISQFSTPLLPRCWSPGRAAPPPWPPCWCSGAWPPAGQLAPPPSLAAASLEAEGETSSLLRDQLREAGHGVLAATLQVGQGCLFDHFEIVMYLVENKSLAIAYVLVS